MARLPDRLTSEGIELRRWDPAFTAQLLVVVHESFDELHQWMSWAQEMPTEGALRDVLRAGQLDFDADRAWEYTVFDADGALPIGGAGIRPSDRPGRFESGYWVRSDRTGQGVAIAATRTLVHAAFRYLDEATSVVIRMDQANLASAAIPKKLGFSLDHEEDREILAIGHTGRGLVWVLDRPG